MSMQDNERELCDDCPYLDDNGDCQSPIDCLDEGVERCTGEEK